MKLQKGIDYGKIQLFKVSNSKNKDIEDAAMKLSGIHILRIRQDFLEINIYKYLDFFKNLNALF